VQLAHFGCDNLQNVVMNGVLGQQLLIKVIQFLYAMAFESCIIALWVAKEM